MYGGLLLWPDLLLWFCTPSRRAEAPGPVTLSNLPRKKGQPVAMPGDGETQMVISNLRLLDVGNVTSDGLVSDLDQAEPTSEIPADQMNTQRALARRFNLVLFDLGVDGIVPNNWVMATEDGLAFKQLSLRDADRLVRALEDLAVGCEPDRATPGPNQLSLFERGPS